MNENLIQDNQYFCNDCQKKVDARKETMFQELPDHLIFVLKRFEYDFQTYTKMKINDYFSFPQELDMSNYSVKDSV